jgi:DNA-binding NtrC family response regulator
MPETILIVDDDSVQRRLLEGMVARFGYRALTADGGDAALRLLAGQGTRIDGLVLDLMMPDLDGLGVLARMREAGLDIPVIVQIPRGGIDTVASVMRAGAADFVLKPASPERLQVSLRNALGARALAGELQRLKGGELPHGLTPLLEPSPGVAASLPEAAGFSLRLIDSRGEVRPLEEIESEVIRFAIAHYRSQMSEVARRLKIGRSTLYRKLEGLGLDGEGQKAPENSPAE